MFTRSIRISFITVFLLCLLGLNANAEDFSNTVKNVKVTSAGEGAVVVDVYIDSKDANVKPQLSTRKYKDDKYIIDLMQVTQKGNVSKDTSGASNAVQSKDISVGKLPGGTARILLNLENPSVKVKDVRYHLIQDKPEAADKEVKKTNTNVLVVADPVKKLEPKISAEKKPVAEEKKTNTNVLKKDAPKNKVASKPENKIEATKEVKKVEPEVIDGPQIIHRTDKPKVEVKKESQANIVNSNSTELAKNKIKPVAVAKKEIKSTLEPEQEVKKETPKELKPEAAAIEPILDDVPEVVLVQTKQEEPVVEAEQKNVEVTEQTPLNLGDDTGGDNLKVVDVKGSDIDFTGMLLTLMGALVIVVPLIFLAIWLINLFYKGGDSMGLKSIPSLGGGNKFKIISSTSLGQGKSIHLLEIRGRQLVVGCTNNSINILTEFGDFDEFVDEQRGVEKSTDLPSINQQASSSKRYKKSRAPLGSFSDLYKDYTKKIDENDLEDEY